MIDVSSPGLALFLTLYFRALGLTALLPFGSALEGLSRKLIIAFGIALLFFDGRPFDQELNSGKLIAEFLIGLMLALPFGLAISLAAGFGELFDIGRGATIAAIYDPVHDTQESTSGVLLKYFSLAIFLSCGAFEGILVSFSQSLELFPLSTGISFDPARLGAFLMTVLNLLSGMLLSFLTLAGLFLTIDLIFACVAKAFKLSFLAESFQLKTVLGLVVLYLILSDQGGRGFVGSFAEWIK